MSATEPLIGRGDVTIRDPLVRLREFGERYAGWVDDAATALAGETAALDDAELERRMARSERVFEAIDPRLLEQERALRREYEAREAAYLRAMEEYGVLSSRAMGLSDEQREALTERTEQTFGRNRKFDISAPALDPVARRVLDAAVLAAAYEQRKNDLLGPAGEVTNELFGEPSGYDGELVYAYEDEEDRPLERVEHLGQYLGRIDWSDGFPEWLATAREHEMRLAERGQSAYVPAPVEATAADGGDRGANASVRRLGAPRRTSMSPFQALTSGAVERIVTRDDISVPSALDALRMRIGDDRADRLAERLRVVQDLQERAPDEWIARRRAELGPPDAGLQAVDPLETRRLEAQVRAARETVAQGLETALRLSELDRDRAAVAQRTAAAAQARLDAASALLAGRDEKGLGLDGWIERDDDRLLRSLMYEDEARHRWYLDAAHDAELAVVDPPGHIVGVLGERPAEPGPERDRYDAVVRDLETHRVLCDSALEAGFDAPVRSFKEQRALDLRIQQVRAVHGMDAGREVPGDAVGPELG